MNFCFVIDNMLSASSQPGKNKRLSQYFTVYEESGIRVLVSLYKDITIPEKYEKRFEKYHFYIDETTLPDYSYLDKIVNLVIEKIQEKKPVNINCGSGMRISTMVLIAVIMKLRDFTYDEALSAVSEVRFAALDIEEENYLKKYRKFFTKE